MKTTTAISMIVGYLAKTFAENKTFQDFTNDFSAATVEWISSLFLNENNQPIEAIQKLRAKPNSSAQQSRINSILEVEIEDNPNAKQYLLAMAAELDKKSAKGENISIEGSGNTQNHSGSGDNVGGNKIVYSNIQGNLHIGDHIININATNFVRELAAILKKPISLVDRLPQNSVSKKTYNNNNNNIDKPTNYFGFILAKDEDKPLNYINKIELSLNQWTSLDNDLTALPKRINLGTIDTDYSQSKEGIEVHINDFFPKNYNESIGSFFKEKNHIICSLQVEYKSIKNNFKRFIENYVDLWNKIPSRQGGFIFVNILIIALPDKKCWHKPVNNESLRQIFHQTCNKKSINLFQYDYPDFKAIETAHIKTWLGRDEVSCYDIISAFSTKIEEQFKKPLSMRDFILKLGEVIKKELKN